MCPSIEPIGSRVEAARCLLRREIDNVHWHCSVISQSSDGQFVCRYTSVNRVVVAKFASDGAAEQNFRALKILSQQRFKHLCVPEPILYDGDTKLLLTTEINGSQCENMQPLHSRDQLLRTGQALKELHSSAVMLGECKTLEDHLHELVRPSPDVLARELPQHAEVVNASLKVLRSSAKSWGRPKSSALHRDFHLRQLLDNGDRIAVVDWDLSAQGDPAFDVGYFTTYLKNHFTDAEASFGITCFLKGYQPGTDILARLRTYEQFNYLRRACRRFRLQDKNWEQALNQMMIRLNLSIGKSTDLEVNLP